MWQLFANAWNTEEVPKEWEEGMAEASSPAASDDVLSTLAFLKQKCAVLQSDIAKVEADMEETKAHVDTGKVEWGDQFETLYVEVSNRWEDSPTPI